MSVGVSLPCSLPDDAQAWRKRAAELNRRQDLVGAAQAMARAVVLAPDDPLIAFLHAQARYEAGYPAADLFARARRLWPDNLDALRNHALALVSEGNPAAAAALLDRAVAKRPDWIEGLRILSGLRRTMGQVTGCDAAYARACHAHADRPALWLAWFGALAQSRDWPAARQVLDAARRAVGETPGIIAAAAFLAGETGDLANAGRLFGQLGDSPDPFVLIGRIRLALRAGQPEAVEALAMPFLAAPFAGQLWPYLSTAWRLLGDPRDAWLSGDPLHVYNNDPGFSPDELAELTGQLRRLHTARAAYPEQSVRSGTQTDRSLLLRHEPVLQQARTKLMTAVAAVVRELPPHRDGHPLLGRSRDGLRLAGSWSVRMGAGGHNVAHTHPAGWLSAVFYVAVPDAGAMGSPPAGHLRLGSPPAELGLDLAPQRVIAPVAGRLVVFPSTMWHGTAPITGGERLNIAFDVVPDQAAS